MKIIKETEKAVQVLSGQIEVEFYNNVSEQDVKYYKDNLIWIPKSICKIKNNKVVEVAHWFAIKNMLCEFLTLVEKNGRKFYI